MLSDTSIVVFGFLYLRSIEWRALDADRQFCSDAHSSTETPQVLVDLSSHIPESNKSRVLITTRILEVAHHTPSYLHEFRPLSFDDSWELFLSKAVVDKCQGSPLSIALLGGLLSGKQKTPESWNQVLQIMLSYRGLFPEDHEISERKLINLWIAESFVQKKGRRNSTGRGCEDYLAELIQRSLILVGKRRIDGGVRSCYIHDMVRDFLISEAKQSRLFEGIWVLEIELTNLQILAIKWGGWVEDDGLGKLTQLRKLKIQGSKDLSSSQDTPFSCHTYLYKLFLKGRLNKLPEETTFYPPNLVKLKLKYSKLEADQMLTLEKLPNLRIPPIIALLLFGKKTGCGNMRGLVHGLLHLQNLQQLKLKRVNPELTEDLDLAEGEELRKIRSITRKIQDKT
ncbi:Disease resistance protein RPP13 [Vitis vinifera]|uniref:Disease resistance protein RPP13 n=1 Tax=Vitis vinifera TaxID=29760 RepID=A0A438D5B1_VITVI|nr:Disease resistance protein RPP13 [Vitis vinifera]